jgi:protein-S-isoprenylcysteine O-methyltransferase Ste14
MSVFWIIRLVLIAVLGATVVAGSYLLRNRKQYQRLLDSWFFNILLVTPYMFSYLLVILPSAEYKVPMLCRIEYQRTQISFVLVGGLLVCAGIVMQIGTIVQRKAIGAQDIRQELMTSGLYRYFRHPIYTGIVWTCLGLAVLLRNPDGLLVMPLIFVINLSQAVSEERNDMIMRFADKYRSYKRKVRLFGPIWLWVALFFIVLALVGCATTPKLTPEDRKKDIEYLAQWARDYSPLVELAEKHKGNPSYEALLPKYLDYAEQAESNQEFYQVVRGYYDLICSTGHRYLVPESEFKWGKAAMILGIIDLGTLTKPKG